MLTFGHGRLQREELAALLTDAGVQAVVDVRRFPGSRANPAAAKGEIPALLGELGIDYRWDQRLGGRRSLTKEQDAASQDTWWHVAAFRAYAGWTRTADFQQAAQQLWEQAREQTTAVMCSEAVWWRCHRRLIADVTQLQAGQDVRHLLHNGTTPAHHPSEGARLGPDGLVVWDGQG